MPPTPNPTPSLTALDIRQWVDDCSFDRAQDYVGSSFYDTRRQGNTLKGWCIGTLPEPYAVQAEVRRHRITGANCTCPVGDNGSCKHVAALLLTWLDDPAAFREVEEIGTTLRTLSNAELIDLVYAMVDRHPDLERLVTELSAGRGIREPVDSKLIQRQVDLVFDLAAHEGEGEIALELSELMEQGHRYAERGWWSDAAAVYQAIATETLDLLFLILDQDSDVAEIVNDCAEALGRCLNASTDATIRHDVLRTLFDIYTWDIKGSTGIGDAIPRIIQDQATATERVIVDGWARAEISAAEQERVGDYRIRLDCFLHAPE